MLSTSASFGEIIAAVKRLGAGEELLSTWETVELLRLASQLQEKVSTAQRALEQLTRRECEVLRALACGSSDKEIEQELGMRPETARTHMVNILAELGVDSRLQTLVLAVRHGVVRIE